MAQELADDMNLRPSRDFPGNSVATAFKGGADVCWNCFTPFGEFRDLPCGGTYVRVCKKAACSNAVGEELSGEKRASFMSRVKAAFKR
jgi:hypothetical protein